MNTILGILDGFYIDNSQNFSVIPHDYRIMFFIVELDRTSAVELIVGLLLYPQFSGVNEEKRDMQGFVGFIGSLFGGGIGVAIVGYLSREWLAIRLKSSIEQELRVRNIVYDLKREACLDALDVVDAAFSQLDWKQEGKILDVKKQHLEIAKARQAYNRLALTCENPKIVELYAEILGLRSPDETIKQISADDIVDLRNEMRKELEFGRKLEFDRAKAWIGNLGGAA